MPLLWYYRAALLDGRSSSSRLLQSKAESVEKIIILAALKNYFALTRFFNQNNFIRD